MILITGATGLVGAHLALHLLESEKVVRATYRSLEKISKTKSLFELLGKQDLFSKINWVQANILDVSALEIAFADVNYVYHCAGFVSFDPQNEAEIRKINIEGTANIVNLCIHKNIKKLCFVSSISALGDKKEHEIYIDETTEWDSEKNHSDYAISKYGAELEVWRGFQEGLQVVIVNPGVVLGYGFENEGSNKIFMTIKNRLLFFTKGTSGFVIADDLVEIMKKLMDSDISGERYCVVAENKSFKDLTAKIAELYAVKPPSIYATKTTTQIISVIDMILSKLKIKKSTFSKFIASSLHANDRYSNKKIVETLNFNFTTINSGIQKIINKN
jgi:dihydroflavonol-4-reductase